MLDLRQTSEYGKYLQSIGWIIERVGGTNYFIRRFPLIGSVIKIQRVEKLNYEEIERIVKKYRTFQIIIEPKNNTDLKSLKAMGYKLSTSTFLPTRTLQLDLTKSQELLQRELHQKTRYNIGLAKKRGLIITHSENIEKFSDLWQRNAFTQRWMFLSQKREINALYSATKSDLILASYGGEIIAGVLTVYSDKISYYMYATSTLLGKSLFAPSLVAWESILTAKKRGYKVFDFEGIYDDRFPIKSWIGFTRFKKGFGGYEVEYPGTLIKNRLPL